MSTITYHKAGVADIELLIDQRVAFLHEYWGQPDATAEATLRSEMRLYFERALPSGEYISWYALADGVVAGIGGMAVLQRPGSFRVADGRCGYIMNMYTHAPYRRRGIAQGVLDRLVESGREIGLQFFELHATQDGEPLYIRNEFQKHGEPTYRKFFA